MKIVMSTANARIFVSGHARKGKKCMSKLKINCKSTFHVEYYYFIVLVLLLLFLAMRRTLFSALWSFCKCSSAVSVCRAGCAQKAIHRGMAYSPVLCIRKS